MSPIVSPVSAVVAASDTLITLLTLFSEINVFTVMSISDNSIIVFIGFKSIPKVFTLIMLTPYLLKSYHILGACQHFKTDVLLNLILPDDLDCPGILHCSMPRCRYKPVR